MHLDIIIDDESEMMMMTTTTKTMMIIIIEGIFVMSSFFDAWRDPFQC